MKPTGLPVCAGRPVFAVSRLARSIFFTYFTYFEKETGKTRSKVVYW
jgi:hypothetical protein